MPVDKLTACWGSIPNKIFTAWVSGYLNFFHKKHLEMVAHVDWYGNTLLATAQGCGKRTCAGAS